MSVKTNGPGKYDDACTAARETTKAVACVLMVINGNQGSGFSVQTLNSDVILRLPSLLRNMADQMEAEIPWVLPHE